MGVIFEEYLVVILSGSFEPNVNFVKFLPTESRASPSVSHP